MLGACTISTQFWPTKTLVRSRFALSRGFTLLELLVALLLLSLVFLLLTSGLHFGTRAWRQEEPNSTSEVATVQHLLRRVLSEARPVMIESTPDVRRHVFFDGSENSVRFIAPMPEHLGVGGFYEVALYLADGGMSGNHLEMSWRLFRAAEASSGLQNQEQRIVLLDNVGDLQFAYYGNPRPQDPPKWFDEWQGLQSLPALIRMHVALGNGKHTWPDLTVATHVQSLNLIIDPENLNF
jgi:general secretion pathway protein J